MTIRIILIILVVFTSCNRVKHSQDIILKDIEVEKISGVKLEYIENGCYFQIQTHEELLLLNNNCADNFISVYSVNNKQKLNSFANKANYLLPELCKTNEQSFKEGHFWIYDINLNALEKFNLSEVSDKTLPVSRSEINISLRGNSDINIVNENTYVGKNTIKGSGVFFINHYPDLLWADYFPRAEKIIPERIPFAYNGKIHFDTETKKVFVAQDFFNRINVYNLNGKIENSLIFNKPSEEPAFNKSGEYFIPPNLQHYYLDLVVTKTKIYALLADELEIKLFTKNNNPRKVLIIDKENFETLRILSFDKNIWQIAVNENREIIYGLLPDTKGKSEVYQFKY